MIRGIDYVLIAVVLANTLMVMWMHHSVYWHQKALEWFTEHVDMDPGSLPGDAPKELVDLVGKKEKKHPDN